MRQISQATWSGTALTAGSALQGAPVDTSYCDAVSAQVVITGASVLFSGQIALQGSVDPGFSSGATTGPTNWNNIPGTSNSVTANGTYLIPMTSICYNWIRLTYTSASGTGTLSAMLKVNGHE